MHQPLGPQSTAGSMKQLKVLGRTAGAVLGEQDGCLQLVARALHILLRHIVDHVAQLAHDAPRLRAQAMRSLLPFFLAAFVSAVACFAPPLNGTHCLLTGL